MRNKISKNNFKLAIVSFLILFLELVLIRFIGTEIRIFAYVPNLILLATFLGSGLGILINMKVPAYVSSAALALVAVCMSVPLFKKITDLLSPISDSFIWFQGSGINVGSIFLGFFLTILLFVLVLVIFIPLGQLLGRLFGNSKQLTVSYSVNIIFSLLGTLTFNLFSYLSINPYLSILFCFVLITVISEKSNRTFSIIASFIITPFLLVSLLGTSNQVWSPYQKLELVDLPANPLLPSGKMLNVNNIGYMGLLDLSKEYQESMPEKLANLGIKTADLGDLGFRNQYDIPYKLHKNPQKVLLIGAGAGNDAAGALRMGVEEITAVEIDPKIIEFGTSYHPEDPYSSEKVKIVNNDGRAHLQKTDQKYDVVVMGLTDSHTLNSSLTNIQLDNFLYTKQSIEDVYEVLGDDGVLFLSFDVRRAWIGARLRGSIENAFGYEPLIISMQNDPPLFGWGGVFFIASKNPDALNQILKQDQELNNFLQTRKVQYDKPQKYLTDNWPYLYLKSSKIPNIHLIILTLLFLLFSFSFKLLKIKSKFETVPFFLGAAFLLYEFQNISRASLLYGNTWKTNVFIISTILIMILFANLLSLKVKIHKKYIYVALILSFIMEFLIPVKVFTQYSGLVKYTLIPLFLNLPLFFSGFLFINYFNETKNRRSFYAYNLFGSAVGGLASYLSYMLGIKFLLILSLAFYLLTLLKIND